MTKNAKEMCWALIALHCGAYRPGDLSQSPPSTKDASSRPDYNRPGGDGLHGLINFITKGKNYSEAAAARRNEREGECTASVPGDWGHK